MKDQEALLEKMDAVNRTLGEVSQRLGRLERAALPFDFGSESSEESVRIGSLLTVANDSIRRLAGKHTQPEILGEYLELASAWAPRCVLFLERGGNLVPWRAVGLDLDDLTRVKIDDEKSLLARSVREQSVIYAEGQRVTDFGWTDGSLPGAAVAIPLCFDELVPVVLYADSSENFSPAGLEFLSLLATQVLKNHALQQGHVQGLGAAPIPAPPLEAPAHEREAEPPSVGTESDTPAVEMEEEAVAEIREEELGSGESLDRDLEPDEVPDTAALEAGEEEGEAVVREEDEIARETEIALEDAEDLVEPEAEVEEVESEEELVEAASDQDESAEPAAGQEQGEGKDFDVLREEALRFARLLVSEIKLYNSEAVDEGRESADIYERLRHDIDRSWEMYRRRAHPSVRSEEDCFDAEVVRILASGERELLGEQYPGPRVD